MSLDQGKGFVKSETTTQDAFLGGRIVAGQPASGFRAGLDSVLLGAAVGTDSRRVLDLGAGTGVAALVALAHNAGRVATLVENNVELARLAAENVAANGFSDRATLVFADVTAPGRLRAEAGLASNHFTSIIANPPYFDVRHGTRAHGAGRSAARHMSAGSLDKWVKTAAASAAPRGEAVFIYRADGLSTLLAAFAARFGAVTVLPITPRHGEAATRILVRGIKGSRAPLTLRAPLVLHDAAGNAFRPEVDAILRGTARLDW